MQAGITTLKGGNEREDIGYVVQVLKQVYLPSRLGMCKHLLGAQLLFPFTTCREVINIMS
ncbi:hypothetical protein GOP47_0023974 [Adiantum capillus-veneris]|uniref:Uncharacterized protein n=1 Tax=Adiantum capillus-veneris TaxID=13818 RepID=A0A9D4U6P3_ADICA|nr:hypothetical protein GOP47_0023974 [Adiantum capillus-veneris]